MSLLKSLLGLLQFNKKNWRAVVLCILAATIFWVLNSLNKEYTANINFPLEFQFDQKNYIPVQSLPEEVSLNVTGLGWDLFRRSLGLNTPPLLIPLEKPSEVKRIVGSTLPALFSKQLETMQINFVGHDTLHLDIRVQSRRWLTLAVDSVAQYLQENYTLVDSVRIMPDSVFVEGPINIISGLEEPYHIQLDDRDIDENYNEGVEVKLPEQIHRNPPVVTVSFRVERLIHTTDSVPLELLNMPKGAQLKMQADRIPVTLRIRESMRDVVRDSVSAVIDLKGFKKGNLRALPELMGLPPDAEVIRLDSVFISY